MPRRGPTKGLAPGQRRRDRDAVATQRRIDAQRARLATNTATARTPRDELTVAVDVLRSAAAPGAHQISQSTVDRLLAPVIEQARHAIDELHSRQSRRADNTLATSPQNKKEKAR